MNGVIAKPWSALKVEFFQGNRQALEGQPGLQADPRHLLVAGVTVQMETAIVMGSR